MSNFDNTRFVSLEEEDKLNGLALEGMFLLGVNEDLSSIDILKKMKVFIEEQRQELTFDLEDLAYKLGSLFGNLIKREHGWQWYQVE